VQHATCAEYADVEALELFAADVDVITYEFENVPAGTAMILAARRAVLPATSVLETTQDRLAEKNFVSRLGIATARYADVGSADALARALDLIGRPAVLKTRRFGYDGKGQAKISRPDDIDVALAAMKGAPAILEGLVPFRREVSVLAVRGLDGSVASFDVPENQHRDHILKTSTVPADIRPATADAARAVGEAGAAALDYVGVLAVELFVVDTGTEERIVANEIAPRVHNSGHWTETACVVSQFEAHVRAICGLPIGSLARHSDVVMENLIGHDVDAVPALLGEAGTSVHLYGKRETRPGRKMGHVNRLVPHR
jgi:5-(carboxyamino)imidazole ribonucleotide synthase